MQFVLFCADASARFLVTNNRRSTALALPSKTERSVP